jgi:hypothetical protein
MTTTGPASVSVLMFAELIASRVIGLPGICSTIKMGEGVGSGSLAEVSEGLAQATRNRKTVRESNGIQRFPFRGMIGSRLSGLDASILLSPGNIS